MPDAPSDEEARLIGEHFAYLQSGHAAGDIVLVGRTQEAPFLGIAIFEAESREDAQRFVDDDPAIRAGVFRVRSLQSYRVALLRDPRA